ncbi:hypothetical protein JHL18_18805 [Clostridium sp. YIM B02505]|uniref:Uncharacterized protein n=1 Tax=Clostridium yunnanense TaxID=2800325 RepID=A0ABS1ETH1_9CLOT|nr:hypothetical protein [Clostridium yunnanense]MBK1812674.1 hypothetical protein [Clostridium yunnanense]
MENKLDTPLYCTNCRAEFSIEQFGGDPYESPLEEIIDYCCLEKLKQELQLLYKTERMYHDYPQSRNKMITRNNSDASDRPSSEEIKLWTNGDKILEKFLLTTSFNLEKRKSYVERCIKEEEVEPIMCTKCGGGIIVFKEGRLEDFEPKLT